MSANQSRDPLLYIMQPTITFPKVNMQEKFVASKTLEKLEEKPLLNEQAKEKFNSQFEDRSPTSDGNAQEKVVDLDKMGNKKTASQKKKLATEDVQEIIGMYHQEQNIQDEIKEESIERKPAKKQQSFSFKKVKSFKEMNIEEKLNYLENFPKQLPPVPCIFITKNSSIKGFLQLKTEGFIEIKQFNEKLVELYLNDLTDIRLIGLK